MDSDELSPYYRWTHKLLINLQRVEKASVLFWCLRCPHQFSRGGRNSTLSSEGQTGSHISREGLGWGVASPLEKSMNRPTLAGLAIGPGSVDSHGPGSWWLDRPGYARSVLLSQAKFVCGHSRLGSLTMKRNRSKGLTRYHCRFPILNQVCNIEGRTNAQIRRQV